MSIDRLIHCLCGIVFGAMALAGPVFAQAYPSKPIRLVVGYSAGGGNDLIARAVAARLQDRLGQPVIVDDQPGAQSMLAAEQVAKSAPDGYTLLLAPSGPMTINPAVYSTLAYSPETDFVPISLLAEFPLLLAVGAEQPVKSVRELIEYGRAKPGVASYASSAAPFQLVAELFNRRTGSKFRQKSFDGSGDAVQAVATGQVLMTIADSGAMSAPLLAGKLHALAITTSQREAAFPDVPTMAEAGIPDMEFSLWTGIVAPAGTPAAIVAILQRSIAETIALPDVQATLARMAVVPRSSTSAEYAALIARDIARWKAIAATVDLKSE